MMRMTMMKMVVNFLIYSQTMMKRMIETFRTLSRAVVD
jgi:hypothetical protein